MKLTKQRRVLVRKIQSLGSLSGEEFTEKSVPIIKKLYPLKPLIPELRKVAWEVFRHYIFDRDSNVCITCGKTCYSGTGRDSRSASHLYHGNRWDYDDIVISTMCGSCHAKIKPGGSMIHIYKRKVIEKWLPTLPNIEEILREKEDDYTEYKPTRQDLWDVIEKYR